MNKTKVAYKTTIVNLLMRFYDCTEGEILIDGINIKNYQLKNCTSNKGRVFTTSKKYDMCM